MRVDLYLVKEGYSGGRDAAKKLIENGLVSIDGETVGKASFPIDETCPHTVEIKKNEETRYASRAGQKLAFALQKSGLSPLGSVALDIGASGGGFTDCLLQNGATAVYALDNGFGQLADFLRKDKRVIVMEHYNARYLDKKDFPLVPTFVTLDVSFISQTLILPSLANVIPTGSFFISLVKPQFEVGRSGVGKGGIVKDSRIRKEALDRVVSFASSLGFTVLGTVESPVLGGDGNTEYLAWYRFDGIKGKEQNATD